MYETVNVTVVGYFNVNICLYFMKFDSGIKGIGKNNLQNKYLFGLY